MEISLHIYSEIWYQDWSKIYLAKNTMNIYLKCTRVRIPT